MKMLHEFITHIILLEAEATAPKFNPQRAAAKNNIRYDGQFAGGYQFTDPITNSTFIFKPTRDKSLESKLKAFRYRFSENH